MKYKVGDKVKCLQNAVESYVPQYQVGQIGVIIGIIETAYDEFYDVQFVDYETYLFREHEVIAE